MGDILRCGSFSQEQDKNNVEKQEDSLQERGWRRTKGITKFQPSRIGPQFNIENFPIQIYERTPDSQELLLNHPTGSLQRYLTNYLGLAEEPCSIGLTQYIPGDIFGIAKVE